MIDVIKFKQRQWYLKNQERLKQKAQEYRINNLDAINKRERERPYNKTAARKTHLKRAYGITEEIYQQMILNQCNRCLICELIFTDKKIHIDHCHTSNKVRGLLCGQCNMALGLIKDSSETALSMYNYLKDHE